MSECVAGIDPVDMIDWCDTCDAVTPYSGETCGCCGRVWGDEGGTCRGVHVVGWDPEP